MPPSYRFPTDRSASVKRTFRNFFQRLMWGSTKLTETEFQLLQKLVDSLPPELRSIIEVQFNAYNLVQREIDGRALNFYRNKGGQPDNMKGLPLLDMTVEEAPLIRLTATIGEDTKPLHATLSAIKGRAFCMAFSHRPQIGRAHV